MRRSQLIALGVAILLILSGCSALPFTNNSAETNTQTPPASTTTQTSSNPQDTQPPASTTSDSESSPVDAENPKTVIKSFYNALYTGDVNTANRLIHANSSAPLYTEGSVEPLQRYNHTVANLTEVSRNSTWATYNLTLVVSNENMTQRRPQIIHLRMNGSVWLIWDSD
jgi:hypothetical protein